MQKYIMLNTLSVLWINRLLMDRDDADLWLFLENINILFFFKF